MRQIFVRWIPGPNEVTVKKFEDLDLKVDEINLLKQAGFTGQFEIRGSSGLGKECHSSKAIFIMQKLLDAPIELPLPDQTTIIYIQKENGWQKLPENARTLDRMIKFEPDPDDAKLIDDFSELETGGKEGGSIYLGI